MVLGLVAGASGAGLAPGAGSAVPDLDWTTLISELLMAPFVVTSMRKLLLLSVCPEAC